MISKIRIRNFRSISDLTVDPADLSILIGKNDTGKSNILRALNLFFNDQTDFRQAFDFSRDFSRQAKTGQGKAPEIRIDIQFNIPSNYQSPEGSRSIEWTRRWRANEVITDDPVFVLKGNKKEEISGRSKLWTYLNNIDYHYIPALKGKEYFSELLSDIYDVLSDVSEEDLVSASKSLQDQVEMILGDVAAELKEVLQSSSIPKLPQNLRSIFRLIQFESEGIDLDRRGDGIRVRHVPSLMKFLCDLKSTRSGHYQTCHIWGFEEPENSVDFISAFELRGQILNIAKKRDFQIFMSTHSPVFFKLEEHEQASTFFFKKEDGATILSSVEGDISDEMGVLRVVSPYVEESLAVVSELKAKVDHLTNRLSKDVIDPSQKIVFVEGDTDVEILTTVKDIFEFFKDVKFVSSIANGYSSANAVVDNIIAWHHLQKSRAMPKVIGVGLVDRDKAGEIAKTTFVDKMVSEKSKNARLLWFQPSSEMAKECIRVGFRPNSSLESFAPLDVWKTALSKDWLARKSADVILDNAVERLRRDLLDSGTKTLFERDEAELLPHLYDVRMEKKRHFCTAFNSAIAADNNLNLRFSTTFSEIRSAFSGAIT
ncbi:ATP-dependent nuclease [Rhizobium sp. BK008]|uniref:ATP-dependent nuclease n=1 Tax=Rhizobium sp. BK008 TaxID=2587094 RepID=UPI00160F8DA4|nr:AAA family ATPase [Rhizobium sp. BK008]MBB4249802.1 energy-coupling factor transporter ATP-binding protein EcfA2 [Rhizobium sp. BK008]